MLTRKLALAGSCILILCHCALPKLPTDQIAVELSSLTEGINQQRESQIKDGEDSRLQYIDSPSVVVSPVFKLPAYLHSLVSELQINAANFNDLLSSFALLFPFNISRSQNTTISANSFHLKINDQPMYAIFDALSQQHNLAWEMEDETLVLHSSISRQVQLPTIPISLAADSNHAVGSLVNHEISNQQFWEQLEESLKIYCQCDISVHDSLSALTFSGTPRAVNKGIKKLDEWVASFSQQLELQVVLLEIALAGKSGLGINWDVFSTQLLGTSFAAKLQQPNNSQSLVVSAKNENAFSSILSAFSQFGKTRVVTSPRGVTMNNQPLEIALVTQTAYLQSTAGAQVSGDGSLLQGGLTPGVVESGFNLVAIPNIVNGRVTLQLSIQLSSLEQINSVQSGSQTIQIPIITQSRYSHRVNLSSHDTLIIGGISVLRDQSNTYLQAQSNDQNQVERVLLITPVITDNVKPKGHRHYPWWRIHSAVHG